MSGEWTHGLFGCFSDCSTCLLVWFCPCIPFGRNAESMGDSCLLYALSQFVPLLNLYCRVKVRGKIRDQKGIQGSCLQDLLCVLFCGLCSLGQETLELSSPGNQNIARE